MSLRYATRRSIRDVAGVLATPLKLMNMSLVMKKSYNSKIMSIAELIFRMLRWGRGFGGSPRCIILKKLTLIISKLSKMTFWKLSIPESCELST